MVLVCNLYPYNIYTAILAKNALNVLSLVLVRT